MITILILSSFSIWINDKTVCTFVFIFLLIFINLYIKTTTTTTNTKNNNIKKQLFYNSPSSRI